MKPVDPINLLFKVENHLEKGEGTAASSLCRTCLEAGFRKIMTIKYPDEDIHNKKKFRGPGDFNLFLYQNNYYSEDVYKRIKDILSEVGHKSTHAVFETELDKANHFYSIVKEFFENYLYPIMNFKTEDLYEHRIRYLERLFKSFHFIRNINQLRVHFNLEAEIDDIMVENPGLSKFIENIENNEFQNTIIVGESGVGKTTLLFQFGKFLIQKKEFIVVIPHFVIDIEEVRKILDENPKTIVLLRDLKEYASNVEFFSKFKDYFLNLKNIITCCRSHYHMQIFTKYEFLEKFFTNQYVLEKSNKHFLKSILDKYSDFYKVHYSKENEKDVKELIVEKADGLVLYMRIAIDDFIKKRADEKEVLSLEYAESLPIGVIALVCNIFHDTFIQVEQENKISRLIEFKILFLLSQLPINRYHHLFLEKLNVEIIEYIRENESENLDVQIHPQDYLYKVDEKFYRFSHYIWKNILFSFDHLFKNAKEKQSDRIKRVLDIVKTTLEAFQSEKSEIVPIMYKSITLAMNKSVFPLPVELWNNALENFSNLYNKMFEEFFEPIGTNKEYLKVIEKDYSAERRHLYFEFLENLRLNGRIIRDVGLSVYANRTFQVGYNISKTIKLDLLIADFVMAMGITARLNSEYEIAIEKYKQVAEIAEKANLPITLADAYHNIANIYLQKKEEKANEYLQKAKEIYEKNNDVKGLASIELSLGEFESFKMNIEIEREHYEKCLKLAKKLEDEKLQMKAISKLGTTYMLNPSEINTAIKLFERSLELALKQFDFIESCTIKLNLSQIYTNINEFDKALEYALSVLEISKSMNFKFYELEALIQMGRLYAIKGENEEALKRLNEALHFNNISDSEQKCLIHRIKSMIFLSEKNYSETLKEFNESEKW